MRQLRQMNEEGRWAMTTTTRKRRRMAPPLALADAAVAPSLAAYTVVLRGSTKTSLLVRIWIWRALKGQARTEGWTETTTTR